MAKGKINVQTENIFPIIKKFLYSDHEIFLRELVSNAVDASSKLKTLQKLGEFKGELGNTRIEVSIDAKAKTLTIKDRGIGMNADEVKKYLNQVAFSGAEEFLKKYEGKADDAGIIGNFGLGFYSAFMVASEVEVHSKSFREEDEAVKWSCDGSPNYTLTKSKKEDRGTEIVLHIAEDSKEFLEENRISGILNKYCKFLPQEIQFGTKTESVDDPSGEKDEAGNPKRIENEVDNIINNTSPAWKKMPADLKDEDYKAFYKELYPFTFDDPLFNIHLNVDYPFNLTGVLFFPKLSGNMELQKNKIQLYSNQVFITDSVEDIVPEFLTLLHGVIDSPDIPLNVSRSYLQSDSNVKKISSHISKKVADKLAEMFKKDRKDYESKWDDIRLFVEYGCLTDEKFFERMKGAILLKNTKGEFFTLEEYQTKIGELQKNKNDELIVLYTNNPEEQHQFIQSADKYNYDVVELSSPLSSHFIQKLEGGEETMRFARVDSDTMDKLIQKADAPETNLSEDQQNELKPVLESVVDKEKFSIVFESLPETEMPMLITRPEFMRRMKEQAETGGGGMFGGATLPDAYNLVVNSNHPLTSKILLEPNADKKKLLAKQAADLALLSQNMLKGEALSKFIERSVDIIE
ncbi:MAG TPA: molecular chaperone HtpG [Flavobacteriales bacterium]|nr:molecular chaperone HtpG [Flavobacteriales bacterium]